MYAHVHSSFIESIDFFVAIKLKIIVYTIVCIPSVQWPTEVRSCLP